MKFESSTIFTKLLASEGVNVVFSHTAETASFNLETRTVTIPLLKDGNKTITNGFIAHEVAHAIWTPKMSAEDYQTYKDIHHAIHNIVEDARIERAMKSTFKGTGKMLFKMYKDFVAKDFFGIKGQDVNAKSFADRINLQYKVGNFYDIAFSTEELAVLKEIDALPLDGSIETQHEVYRVSKIIQDMMLQQQPEHEPDTEGQGDSGEGVQSDEESDESQSVQGNAESIEDDAEQDEDEFSSESQSDEAAESDETEEGQGGTADEDDETEEGESNSGSNSSDSDLSNIDEQITTQDHANESLADETQARNNNNNHRSHVQNLDFEKLSADLTGEKGTNELLDALVKCGSIAKGIAKEIKANRLIVSAPYFLRYCQKFSQKYYLSEDTIFDEKAFTIFNTSTRHSAGYSFGTWSATHWADTYSYAKKVSTQLTSEFKMKASASESRRTRLNKTGILNMGKLHEASYNDDVFLANQIIDDGENHGVVVLIDMSASMRGRVYQITIRKALATALFCQANNIPFKIMGYTSGEVINESLMSDEHRRVICQLRRPTARLIEITSSEMTPKQSINAFKAVVHGYRDNIIICNGTPLNDLIVLMAEDVRDFQIHNAIDKMSLTVMTDGQSHDFLQDIGWSSSASTVNYKSKSGKHYAFTLSGSTPSFARTCNALEILKGEVKGLSISYVLTGTGFKDIRRVLFNSDSYSTYPGQGVFDKALPSEDVVNKIFSKAAKSKNIQRFKNVGVCNSLIIENGRLQELNISATLKSQVKIAQKQMAAHGMDLKAGKIFARDLIDTIA